LILGLAEVSWHNLVGGWALSYLPQEFEDSRDAKDALDLDGHDLDGSRIAVEYSRGSRRDRGDDRGGYRGGGGGGGYDRGYDRGGDRGYDRGGDRGGYRDRDRDRDRDRAPRAPSRFSPPRNTDYRCLIEDLPSGCSWQDLKDHFRQCGDVCFADVRRERNGDLGVIEFKYEDDLYRAVEELDRTRIHGSTIRVINDYKRRSPPRDRRGRSPSQSPRNSPGAGGDKRRSPTPSPERGEKS